MGDTGRWGAGVATALAALALAGCGGEGADDAGRSTATTPPTATTGIDPAGAMLADGGLSVAEARGAPPGELIAVRAFVFVSADGTARLCDLVLESYPPQCGGPEMPTTGLPPELVADLPTQDGASWSDDPVQLIGTVSDGVFVNDPAALAAG